MRNWIRRYGTESEFATVVTAATLVLGIIMLVAGLIIFVQINDRNNKAANAAKEVAALTTACDGAEQDYLQRLDQANRAWNAVRGSYGKLLSSTAKIADIQVICGNTTDLNERLEGATTNELVEIYRDAHDLNGQLSAAVNSPQTELEQASAAVGAIDLAKAGRATAWNKITNPPSDAVNLPAARLNFAAGEDQLRQAQSLMVESVWDRAKAIALSALASFQMALDHASSPTPTPLPTNTPRPTNTPEPTDEPAPTSSSSSWIYDDSSSSSDSGSDSGSWDSGGSDSDSWGDYDSGDDSNSWDSGGDDSGSWDSGGDDSGSW